MSRPATDSHLLPVLVCAALTSAIVSSLGMLLVPTISQEMDVSVGTAQWMLTVNLLVGAVSTPLMGRLSDGPHKKPLLLGALTVILAGSLLAACAPNFTVFLIGRALQGLSYGIVPVTIALARRYLPPEKVKSGISALSVTVATGLGLGYPLTGTLASSFGFRSAFGFAAVFLIATGAIVLRVVPDGPDERALRIPFDTLGAVLLGIGLSTLLLLVAEGPTWGWSSGPVLALAPVAAVSLTSWVLLELRTPHPLIDLRVFGHKDVVLANVTAIGLGAAMYVGLSVSSLIAQAPAATGYGAELPLFWAGFVMLPLSIGSLGSNRFVRAAARRIRLTTFLPLGAAMVTVSALRLWASHDELWEILVGMLLFGTGIGMTYAAMPALIARSVVATELGSAVSFNQVLRTVGGSLGSAAAGAVLAAHPGPGMHPGASGITLALFIGFAMSATVFISLGTNYLGSVWGGRGRWWAE